LREVALVVLVAAAILLPGLWSYTLIDPWEGHYAEVGRRILADSDWVSLHWQNESFHSKPALTPWLVAASLGAHGIATDGGYSGEIVSSAWTVWAVRLPFALCGIAGLVAVWLMLARLVSRRAGWIALIALGTTPFYFLVARQAITDMPMVAASIGALSCFALAVHDGDRSLRRLWWRFDAYHVVITTALVVVGVQVAYNTSYFVQRPGVGRGIRAAYPELWVSVPFVGGMALVIVLTTVVWRVRTTRGVYLLWAYLLLGVSVLAKGPPGAVMVVFVCAGYIAATGQWRLLLRLRLVEGVLLAVLVAAPWHVAAALKDGYPFLKEYFGHHWLKRAGAGVHMVNRPGEGTFVYYAQQLGVGLWPYLVVVPAAVIAAVRARADSPAGHVRLLALIWAMGGLFLFTSVETKFHHYVLPAVPGFAVLVAMWLDDAISGRARHAGAAIAIGVGFCALVTRDVMGQQERLLELSTYRYDRPWPSGEPWTVDCSTALLWFGVAFCVAGMALCIPRIQRWAALGVIGVAVVFAYYAMTPYMRAVAPHWGQGQIHRAYYESRAVHGIDVFYDIDDGGAGEGEIEFETFVPDSLEVGDDVRIRIHAGAPVRELAGTVSRIRGDRVWARATGVPAATPSRIVVDADRLIAWNLFWRSEIFWSGGELWGPTPDTRTAFKHGEDEAFLAYLNRPESADRTFFVITEASQVNRLRGILPTSGARDSLEVVDRSSNKFTLVRFEL
jgi:4-amino-4-deoxy-L-arabinose transferase-like glycosyltransferase